MDCNKYPAESDMEAVSEQAVRALSAYNLISVSETGAALLTTKVLAIVSTNWLEFLIQMGRRRSIFDCVEQLQIESAQVWPNSWNFSSRGSVWITRRIAWLCTLVARCKARQNSGEDAAEQDNLPQEIHCRLQLDYVGCAGASSDSSPVERADDKKNKRVTRGESENLRKVEASCTKQTC
jgi:hypothetical protein